MNKKDLRFSIDNAALILNHIVSHDDVVEYKKKDGILTLTMKNGDIVDMTVPQQVKPKRVRDIPVGKSFFTTLDENTKNLVDIGIGREFNQNDKHRHGGPWDRGSADSYYRRGVDPHYFVGASYQTKRIEASDMTEDEIADYKEGYDTNESEANFYDY